MKRLTVFFAATAALALVVGCGDNKEPGTELGPQTDPGTIGTLPPAVDIPPSTPFANAISFESPGCTSLDSCETVTFCPGGIGTYTPPDGGVGGGDFVYGLGEDQVWTINEDFAFTFEYKPGGAITSPLGNVLLPGIANTTLCDTLAESVQRNPLQIADDNELDSLDENGEAISSRGSRANELPDI